MSSQTSRINHRQLTSLAADLLVGPLHESDESWKTPDNPVPQSVLKSAETYLNSLYGHASTHVSSLTNSSRTPQQESADRDEDGDLDDDDLGDDLDDDDSISAPTNKQATHRQPVVSQNQTPSKAIIAILPIPHWSLLVTSFMLGALVVLLAVSMSSNHALSR